MADCVPRTSPNARFLRADARAARAPGGSIQGALSVSVLTHAFGFLLLALAISRLPADDHRSTVISDMSAQIVWLPQPGIPHGGGGSGDGEPEPARRAELPGREALTVPAVSRESSLTDTSRIDDQEIQVPAVPMMAGVHELPG